MPCHVVTIYSKSNCSLCGEVIATVEEVARTRSLNVRVVDIRLDPELFARYRYDLPVVTVDGVEVARHRLEAAALLEYLAGTPVAQPGPEPER